MSKSNKLSRRDLLRGAGQAGVGAAAFTMGSPQQMLTQAVLKNWFQRANADAVGALSPRYYINCLFPGGPVRFSWDHWLRTNTSDPAMILPPAAATNFTYNSGTRKTTGFEYRTFDYNGVQIPQFFKSMNSTDLANLMDSFLVIRGYGSGVDGHLNNENSQTLPLAGQPSLSGLLADHSNRSFRAVQSGSRGGGNFASASNVGLNVVSIDKPLRDLLAPVAATSNLRTLRKANEDAFLSLRSLLNISAPDTQAMRIAKGTLQDSYHLLTGNYANYAAQWPTLMSDYQTAFESGARTAVLPGINSTMDGSQRLQIISDGTNLFNLDHNPTYSLYAAGQDINQVLDQATIDNIGASFALAEYCITNDLVSSIELQFDRMRGVRESVGGGATSNHNHDSHQSGAYVIVLMTATMWAGYTNCLMLLRNRLIAAGKWNNTIIHTTADFDRELSADGFGSGHGFNQMISSIFSGVITGGPYVVGNVYQKSGTDKISQGTAAPIAGYSADFPKPAAMASTLYTLLSVAKNPWQNLASPLISLQPDGRLLLPYGAGKVV
jgi:hypothetical protein